MTIAFKKNRLVLAILATLLLTNGAAYANGSYGGTVQSGGTLAQQPLAGVRVKLFNATERQPRLLAHAVTDAAGHFTFTTPHMTTTSQSTLYATASVANGVELVTILGRVLPPSFTINELTTVAAAYSMAQFYKSGVISGNAFSLQIAAGMNDNLVSSVTGVSSPVLTASPNADQTNSLRSTRALANLVAATVADPASAILLLHLSTLPNSSAPINTAQALANVARNPGHNVAALFSLSQGSALYLPTLQHIPDAWTIAVKINDSGDDTQPIGGPGNLVFDAKGYAWSTNNVVQGTTGSAQNILVFKANGQPADGSNGSPKSPVTGGGILGGGFGICIAPDGTVWEGNFGWGGINPSPTPPGSGSISRFTPSGQPLSPPDGYYGTVDRAQGLASDANGNIWIPSYGNDSVVVFPNGDPTNPVSFQEASGSHPFDISAATDGDAWVVNSGGGNVGSSIVKFTRTGQTISPLFKVPLGSSLKGMALDSAGNAWVASGGDSKIYGVRPNGTVIGAYGGGGVNGPWSVTVDGKDNLWVANFGPLSGNFTTGGISKLCGIRSIGIFPCVKVGDPLSPSTGFTLPSAGDEVLLHNGDPLYGVGKPPSYTPLMRQTKAAIDRAGNLWVTNNWKPDFGVDILSNPGGDGIVIFVGLATPPNPRCCGDGNWGSM